MGLRRGEGTVYAVIEGFVVGNVFVFETVVVQP